MGEALPNRLGCPVVESAVRAKALALRELPGHCPPALGKTLEHTRERAVALSRKDTGLALATYVTNQAAACVAAWRAEEISPAVAIAVLERLTRGL